MDAKVMREFEHMVKVLRSQLEEEDFIEGSSSVEYANRCTLRDDTQLELRFTVAPGEGRKVTWTL